MKYASHWERERVLFLTMIPDMALPPMGAPPQEEKYNVHYKMISLCQAFDIKAVKTQGKGWLNQHGGVTKES